MKQYLSILSILFILFPGCQKPSGQIFLESPEKIPDQAEQACVDASVFSHSRLLLTEAVQNHPRAAEYVKLFNRLEELDNRTFLNLIHVNRYEFTLLLPTNQAIKTFSESYKLETLTDEQLLRLLKMHIVIKEIPYTYFFKGQPLASNLASHIMRFSKDDEGCVVINEQASFLMVDDYAQNGVIHEISRVILPDDGL